MESCLFCKIINKEIPADIIYEDEDTIAILDIHPVNIGHALVIPKRHIENIYGFEEGDTNAVFSVAQKMTKAVKTAVQAEGINLHMNNERPAGQMVFHAHIHVIPRYDNDGLKAWKGARGYEDGEAEETAKKITSML